MEKTKAEKITEIKGLLKISTGKTFLRTYKDEIVEYKVEDGNLCFWSELFFQWKKDNLVTWSSDQLDNLLSILEGKKSNAATYQSIDIT
jgi:hypothetical protein